MGRLRLLYERCQPRKLGHKELLDTDPGKGYNRMVEWAIDGNRGGSCDV